MNNTGLNYVDKSGARYNIIKGADNKYYIADPNFELNAAHKAFSVTQGVPVAPATPAPKPTAANPSTPSVTTPKTLSGFLGETTTDTAIQSAAAVANFIPVVGPIASTVLSIGDAIFGGGDPTALSVLINEIVQGRATIAQLNNQIAGYTVDSFTIPAGFNPTDKAGTAALVEGIVEQYAGVSQSDVESSNRRADYYKAISAINSQISTLTNQAETIATIEKLIPGTTTAPPPTASTSSVVSSPSAVATMLQQTTPSATPSSILETGTIAPALTTTATSDQSLWIIGALAAIMAAAILL